MLAVPDSRHFTSGSNGSGRLLDIVCSAAVSDWCLAGTAWSHSPASRVERPVLNSGAVGWLQEIVEAVLLQSGLAAVPQGRQVQPQGLLGFCRLWHEFWARESIGHCWSIAACSFKGGADFKNCCSFGAGDIPHEMY